MNKKTGIDRLNRLLPKMTQQEKLNVIHDITYDLPATEVSEIEIEALGVCEELNSGEDGIVPATQLLAGSLVK